MAFWSLGKVTSAALNPLAGGTMPIAIDFGLASLKLLQLGSGEPVSLIAAAAVDTPDALIHDPGKRFEFQFMALPRLLKSAGFRGKKAVCAIPAGQMFVKHMQFPKTDGVDLASLVATGVPQALGCAPEALILRHFAVDGSNSPGSGGGSASGIKQEVICMAAAREFVSRLMKAIKECKLECVGIHPEAIATVCAFESIHRRVSDAHIGTLYLDIGCGTTKVWITHGTTLVFAKIIQCGGKDFDAAVSHALDISIGAARTKRLAASVLVAPAARPQNMPTSAAQTIATTSANLLNADGTQMSADIAAVATGDERRVGKTPPGLTQDIVEQSIVDVAPPEFDLTDVLDTMTDEIAMCLRYYESMFPGRRVDRAILYGGESRHRGLCQHMARKLRLPTHVADPLARMARTGKESVLGVDFTTPQPGWTVPFGLSLCPQDL